MKTTLFNIALTISLTTAFGCATPAKVSNMTHFSSSDVWAKPNTTFYKTISVEEVKGGEKTNPLWLSKVAS